MAQAWPKRTLWRRTRCISIISGFSRDWIKNSVSRAKQGRVAWIAIPSSQMQSALRCHKDSHDSIPKFVLRLCQVIVLDEDDKIVGHVSKYISHRFVPGAPRGILHRAFSVFLFDQDKRLLLQKVCSLVTLQSPRHGDEHSTPSMPLHLLYLYDCFPAVPSCSVLIHSVHPPKSRFRTCGPIPAARIRCSATTHRRWGQGSPIGNMSSISISSWTLQLWSDLLLLNNRTLHSREPCSESFEVKVRFGIFNHGWSSHRNSSVLFIAVNDASRLTTAQVVNVILGLRSEIVAKVHWNKQGDPLGVGPCFSRDGFLHGPFTSVASSLSTRFCSFTGFKQDLLFAFVYTMAVR